MICVQKDFGMGVSRYFIFGRTYPLNLSTFPNMRAVWSPMHCSVTRFTLAEHFGTKCQNHGTSMGVQCLAAVGQQQSIPPPFLAV